MTFLTSIIFFAIFSITAPVPSVEAQQCSSGCFTQQSSEMRQCSSSYGPQDKQACRYAASERAAACVRACNQGNKQQDREPTRNRPQPRPF